MLEVTQTNDSGYTVYSFTANQTEYEVLTDDGQTFTVYSSRIGRSGRPAPQCYDSLAHLASRSKALKNLAALIAA